MFWERRDHYSQVPEIDMKFNRVHTKSTDPVGSLFDVAEIREADVAPPSKTFVSSLSALTSVTFVTALTLQELEKQVRERFVSDDIIEVD